MGTTNGVPMIKDIRTTGPRDLRAILSGKHILVVEDDPVVAVDYRFQLQAIGITQTLQPTIRRALAYLADHDVDAAIVDNQLPDGTCERVVAELMRRHIPFIVVSGDTFGMRETGGAPVLTKPVRPDEVRDNLAAVIADLSAS